MVACSHAETSFIERYRACSRDREDSYETLGEYLYLAVRELSVNACDLSSVYLTQIQACSQPLVSVSLVPSSFTWVSVTACAYSVLLCAARSWLILFRLTIFFFNVVTAIIPAYMSTAGPALGLRQMTSSRFSWGFYGAKFVALLNCIACVGWSIVNTISGAQVLQAVADYKISAAAGTVIIAIVTLVVGLFGYRFVHRYETFAWIPTAISFFVLLGVSAKHLVNSPMPTGSAEAASVLSFGGVIFGFTIGWTSLASDYNVYMPATASKWKIFMWTYVGLIFPLVLVEWLGAAIACAAFDIDSWFQAYTDNELGGLLYQVFVPAMGGGGKFFMVLLVLSVVANK